MDILERNLEDIVSPFSYRLSLEHFGIIRREFNIADLVRQGKRNREIAEFLGITQRTVETHRRNLRVKLGIDNRKINLRTHLMAMATEKEAGAWIRENIDFSRYDNKMQDIMIYFGDTVDGNMVKQVLTEI